MGRRRKLLVAVLGIVVIVAAIGGVRATRSREPQRLDPAMVPTPTIREGSAHGLGELRRGRIRAIEIRPGTLRLEGVVVDDHEKPVAGAKVVLGHARETVSEGDGSFAFDHLAEAEYVITAEVASGAYAEDKTALNEHTDLVTLKLRRGAQLVVHVVDAAS